MVDGCAVGSRHSVYSTQDPKTEHCAIPNSTFPNLPLGQLQLGRGETRTEHQSCLAGGRRAPSECCCYILYIFVLRIGPRGGPPQTYQRVLGRTVQRGSDGQPHVYIYIYMRTHIYTCVYIAASCTRAHFTRKCASYVHMTESEPSLANRRRFRLLGRPGRAAETIEAQPNQANRKLIGCVGGLAGVHVPTASRALCCLAIGSRSTVCRRRQGRAPHFDQDRLVVLVDSELDPDIGRPR